MQANEGFKAPKDEYQAGSIMRVQVKDFMTFLDATFELGPRLNLIIGPNGTGKSSLVCAICLGLGGSTDILGRAKDVSDFIRKNASKATVRVTISEGPSRRPTIVERSFGTNTDNDQFYNKWLINGAERDMIAVKEKAKSLHISLDNLCQFLPQDKVKAFADMDSVQLLKETQRAIGTSELFDQHQRLIQLTEEIGANAATQKGKREAVAQLQRQQDQLKRDVDRFAKQEKLLDQAKVYDDRILWLKYAALEAEKAKVERDFEQAVDNLEQVQAEAAGVDRDKLDAHKKAIKDLDRQLRNHSAEDKRLDKEVDKADDALTAEMKKVTDLAEALRGLPAKSKELRRKQEAERRKLEKLVNDLNKTQNDDAERELAAHLQAATEAAQQAADRKSVLEETYSERCRELKNASDTLAARKRDLDRARQFRRVRMNNLVGKLTHNPAVADANRLLDWLEKPGHRARFRHEVLGPLVAEVKTPNMFFATALTNHLSVNDLCKYIVICKEDQELLMQTCKELGLQVDILRPTRDLNTPVRAPCPAEELKNLGVVATMDQAFEAPMAVKHVLCDFNGVHLIHLIDRKIEGGEDARQQLFQRSGGKMTHFFAHGEHVRTFRSEFDKTNTWLEVRGFKHGPDMLIAGRGAAGAENDTADLEKRVREQEEVVQDLTDRLAEMTEEMRKAEDEVDAARREKARLTARHAEVHKGKGEARRRHMVAKSSYDTLMAKPDPLASKPDYERRLAEAQTAVAKLAIDLSELTVKATNLRNRISLLQLSQKEASLKDRALEDSNQRHKVKVEERKELLGLVKAALKVATKAAGDAEALAKREATETPEQAEAFAHILDKTIEELEAMSAELRDQADMMNVGGNVHVRQEYVERRKKIDDLERDLAGLRGAEARLKAERDVLRAQWQPRLTEISRRINDTFSAMFKLVGVEGRVDLAHGEDPNDFSSYKMAIRVRFRANAPLQVLNANHQSGGERSVTTMLYLVSLQGVTAVPFRVVDEINQGMDQINERKIFSVLVNKACEPNTPQCLLLTPKLLADLPFTPDVMTLTILNGAHISEVGTGGKPLPIETLWGPSIKRMRTGMDGAYIPVGNRYN